MGFVWGTNILIYDFEGVIVWTSWLDVIEVLNQVQISRPKMIRLRKSIVTIFQDAQNLKLIKPRFTVLMKTIKTKDVDKLTSTLLGKAKSVFYAEIP